MYPPSAVSFSQKASKATATACAVGSPDSRFALAAFTMPASRAIAADVVRISAETPSTVFARESSSSATASSASRILISSASGLPVIGSAAEVGSGVENRNHGAQTEPALTPIPAMRLSTLAVIRLRPVRMREALRANRPQRRRRHRQHARSPNPRMLHRESWTDNMLEASTGSPSPSAMVTSTGRSAAARAKSAAGRAWSPTRDPIVVVAIAMFSVLPVPCRACFPVRRRAGRRCGCHLRQPVPVRPRAALGRAHLRPPRPLLLVLACADSTS